MRSRLIPFIFLSLTPMVANAADLPSKKSGAQEKAPYFYYWTGLYAGAHVGYGWNTSNRDTKIYTTGEFYNSTVLKSEGLFGGIQLDTSKNLWANQDLIDSICRVAEERRHGRSIPGTF